MSEMQCPKCDGDEITVQRPRGWGGLLLLLGLLLLAVGFTQLQSWFPSANFWQDLIMSETLSIPEQYTWWDFMKYNLSFAAISGLGVALAGFGIWLMGTSVLECKVCGYQEWAQGHGGQTK